MDIGQLLQAFRFGVLQDCKNIMLKLKRENISLDEFVEWIEEESKVVEETRQVSNEYDAPVENPRKLLRRRCPDCGNYLVIKPVNHSSSTAIEDAPELKSVWICKRCKFDEFSDKPIHEEIEPHLIDVPEFESSGKPKKRRKQSRIIHPNSHRMLYYRNPRRRVR